MNAIEWFIPDRERDHIGRLRARLCVTYSLLVAANSALFAVLHEVHHLPGTGRTVIYVLVGICAASFAFPVLMKAGVPLRALCQAFMAFFQSGIIAVAWVDGGFASGATYWLIVMPLAGAFIGGARLGWTVAAVSLVAGVAMLSLSASGYEFPVSLSPEKAEIHRMLNLVCAVGFIAALAALYEGPIVRHLRDLSDRLRAANTDLRGELAERRRAQDRAEAASRAKDVLLANMSHEFRTPLTAILGATEILLDEADDDHKPFLQSIGRGGQRLLVTLDGVLDLAWIESGEMGLEPDEVDVAAEVHEAVGAFRATAQSKGLTLVARGETAIAAVDPAAFRRVILALIDNAIRFTDDGGVTLTVGQRPEAVVVEVADTGIGIRPDFLPQAFEPFKQASEGDARTHEGVGLGLTVAHRLVERMGGTMEVESDEGAGTTVRVGLPVAAPAWDAASGDSAAGVPSVSVEVRPASGPSA